MSKEITPLEALERIKSDLEYITRLDYVDPIVRGEVREELYKIYHRELPELDIIETALKRLEEIDEAYECLPVDFRKIIKVLEIIKEKRVNVGYLLHDIEEHFMKYEEYLENFDYYQDVLIPLTSKEYELLKEVLQ